MKPDARRDWLHLLVYLAICFAVTYAVEIPLMWGRTFADASLDPKSAFAVNSLMLLPALCVCLTRLLTRQGWEESYLHLHCKGNAKYYALAFAMPVAASVLTALLCAPLYGGLDVERIRTETSFPEACGIFLFQLASSVILLLPGFGEELGWRGYLYPLLERRLGLLPAMLAGGVIWGLWHAPLTYAGHNFGQHYGGYPWMGYVCMSLFCICTGIPMYYLTRKTKSVFPAALFHMVNNQIMGFTQSLLLPQLADQTEPSPFIVGFACIPYGCFAVLCMVQMLREEKARA